MKNVGFIVIALALMTLVSLPVSAARTGDMEYMNSVKADYMEKINNEGQTLIFDDIKTVSAGESYSFPLTVGTGTYEIWGVGGNGVQNLDLCIYSSNGDVLSESSGSGNHPVLSFTEPVSRPHRVEVSSSDYESGMSEGYFLVIVVKK